MKDLIIKIEGCQSKQAGYELLKGLKKSDLKVITDELGIKVLSSYTKEYIKQLIIDLLLGLKLRKQFFDYLQQC